MHVLSELRERCKCGVFVSINEHRTYYQTVEQWLENADADVAPDVRAVMVAQDTIVWVQAYPDTPVGHYASYHWNLDQALTDVLRAVTTERS